MKKIKNFLIVLLCLLPVWLFTQNVAINSTGVAPNASAMLDISSTDKGILIPRVTLTANNSISPITAPADALLIYNTATAGVAPNNVIPGQKSINLVNWIDITTIQGSGNPTTIKEYNYTYTENYIGNIYYRLKQVDYDGQYEYHNIVSTNCDIIGNNINVYPNPVQKGSEINIEGYYQSYIVYDVLGRKCDINHLKEGLYILLIDGSYTIKLIIK